MGFFSSLFGSGNKQKEDTAVSFGLITAKGIRDLADRFENDSGFMMEMMSEAFEGTFALHEKEGKPTGGFEFILSNDQLPAVGYQGVFNPDSKTFFIYSLYLANMSPYYIEICNGTKTVCLVSNSETNLIDRTAVEYLIENEGYSLKKV